MSRRCTIWLVLGCLVLAALELRGACALLVRSIRQPAALRLAVDAAAPSHGLELDRSELDRSGALTARWDSPASSAARGARRGGAQATERLP